MTGLLTGSLKIPVVTNFPCQLTSRGNPTFTDKIFMIRRLMAQLGILTLENYRERMQFRAHHTCHNGRIGFHKFLRSGFVTGPKITMPNVLSPGSRVRPARMICPDFVASRDRTECRSTAA